MFRLFFVFEEERGFAVRREVVELYLVVGLCRVGTGLVLVSRRTEIMRNIKVVFVCVLGFFLK